MKLVIGIDRGEGLEKVSTTPRSIIEWERKTKSKISSLANGIGLEDMALLAWFTLGTPGSFNDFMDTLIDVEPLADENLNSPHLEASHGE
jgi:hypothetical protein